MNVKEYLGQIEDLDIKIDQRIKQREDLLARAYSITVANDPNKVQSSGSVDTIGNVVSMAVDIENEINELIDLFISLKNKIISEIQTMYCGKNTVKYRRILYKRYVEYKDFYKISDEMNYDYKWTCKLHGYALQEFDKIRNNTTKDD